MHVPARSAVASMPATSTAVSRWVSCAVAALAVLAAVLVIADAPDGFRGAVVAAAWLSAPGLAVLPRASRFTSAAAVALVVAFSMAIGTVVALALIWSRWWHPLTVGVVVLLASAAAIALRQLGGWPPRLHRSDSPEPAPAATRWVLAFDDGRQHQVSGSVLVGRDPPTDTRSSHAVIAVPDVGRTVSRRHFVLSADPDTLLVVDQGSSNGTVVTGSDAVSRRCPAGVALPVHHEDIVSFGDHWLQARSVTEPVAGDAPPVAARLVEHRSRRSLGADPRHLVPALALLVATTAWIIALHGTSAVGLGAWGLLPRFGWWWILSLALSLGVLLWGLVGPRTLPEGWMAAHGALLVLILYGSATFVEEAPRLPWVYKHIAVTRYLEQHGGVDPAIDLYQRWPGFFAWTAQLARLVDRPDVVSWAGLAEPVFALLDALLVLAIASVISRQRRFAWTAALLFTLANWINQNYFAPQALGYALYLTVALLVLATATAAPRPFGVRLEGLLTRLLRRFRPPALATADHALADFAPAAAPGRGWTFVAVLGAFAVIVASHQLTPYLSLLVLAPLFVLGYFRPLWLALAMGALAVLYLVPNLGFIQSHYGIFSGFDPVANAVYSTVDRTKLPASQVWSARGSYLICAIVLVAGAVGCVRRARAGAVRTAVVVGWMTLAPPLLLGVQSYGGEGRLRVYLFALPWCAMAAAWAFWPTRALPGRGVRAALVATVVALATLFTLSYFVSEAQVRVPPSEVTAAEWVDAQARPGDVLLAASPVFPLLIGPHYNDLVPEAELSRYVVYYPDEMTRDDVIGIATELNGGAPPRRLLVVFSDEQYAFSERNNLFRPGELTRLESEITRSAGDQRVYQQSGVRIYQVR